MSVLTSEVKWMRAQSANDGASNGGRMSDNVIASAVKNAIFPNVTQQQRTDGVTQYRKVFIKNMNSDGDAMTEVKVFVEHHTAGQDSVVFFPGTQTNVQSAVPGSERNYGCGQLNSDTGSEALVIEVLTEDDALDYFQVGDLIRISDKDDINDSGNEEYVRIYGEPTYVGNVATIELETPLQNTYAAANTRVASVYEAEDIVATVDDPILTSDAGEFNGSDQITPDNRGTIEQNWTLTFTSTSAFSVSGDSVGTVGTGSTAADFEPTNTGANAPYFHLESTAWGGTFAPGDTLTWSTHPAALPLWYQRTVPAGAAQQANDSVIVGIDYESA